MTLERVITSALLRRFCNYFSTVRRDILRYYRRVKCGLLSVSGILLDVLGDLDPVSIDRYWSREL